MDKSSQTLVPQGSEEVGSASDVCGACRSNCCTKRLPIFLLDSEEKLFQGRLQGGDELVRGESSWTVAVSRCPHLDDQSRCTIYGLRPSDCRMHPLLFELVEGEICFRIDVTCAQSFVLGEEALRARGRWYQERVSHQGLDEAYTEYVEKHYSSKEIGAGVTHIPLDDFFALRRRLGPEGACRHLVQTSVLSQDEGASVLGSLKDLRSPEELPESSCR